MNLFDDKTLTPMLLGGNRAPFDSEEYIFELKFDGNRCLLYLDEHGTHIRNRRNKDVTHLYPELRDTHTQVDVRCILDGEMTVCREGKPLFFEQQKRALMIDPLKIEQAARREPVTFMAFDILYRGNEDLLTQPLTARKERLFAAVRESERLALSRHIERDGMAFFELAKAEGLEGIVAKRKESLYYPGVRTDEWLKMKALRDDDFAVCGYALTEGGAMSLLLAQAVGGGRGGEKTRGAWRYCGRVTVGGEREDFCCVWRCPPVDKRTLYPDFPEEAGVVWIQPELVCTVEFLERTQSGGLRQPVYRGLREDKRPEECY
ncbi:MAG: DNA ligase [Oscillospiraceae bacterium]|nr:DNA ligase [Oscillospiraceae bacterium]